MRESTYVPFGVCFRGPTEEEHVVELKVAFSFRSRKKANENRSSSPHDFSVARRIAKKDWEERLDRMRVQGARLLSRERFTRPFITVS